MTASTAAPTATTDGPRTGPVAAPDVEPVVAPGRGGLLRALVDALEASGVAWAAQGASDAVDRWVGDDGPADLDVWVARLPGEVAALLDSLGARVAQRDDPRRLRHVSWAVPLPGSVAVVDLTLGDLRVGPVLLVPAAEVATRPGGPVRRLDGAAAALDLAVRPLLRGRVVDGDRLAEARAAWRGSDGAAREAVRDRLARAGRGLADEAVALLDGEDRDPARAVRRARAALLGRTVEPRAWGPTWRQRRSITPGALPVPRAPGPAGLRTRGVVVVLVGTDGSGKSSVAEEVAGELGRLGVGVRTAYFGMARGNLPGVATARRLLGVAAAGDAASGVTPPHVAAPRATPAVPAPPPEPSRTEPSHARLRRVAAWVYAAEYVWRWSRLVAPEVARGRVVLCDRWITDLRESPWPASAAPRVLERVLPRPHVMVLPDAPDATIHARKPERTAAEQARQQELFRRLVTDARVRRAGVVVDTSRRPTDVTGVLRAVLAAAHRGHRDTP